MVRTVDGIRCSMAILWQAYLPGISHRRPNNLGSEKQPLPFYSPFST